MPVTPSPSQVPALHSVPGSNLRQPPLPSHFPSSPQVAGVLATHWRASLGWPPRGTKAQSPSELAKSHLLHVSPQAEVQQIPSAQNPVWQSWSQVQDSAFPLDCLASLDEQTLGWAPSEIFPSWCPPPSRSALAKLAPLQPPAATTAHTARPIQAQAVPLSDDVDSLTPARRKSALILSPGVLMVRLTVAVLFAPPRAGRAVWAGRGGSIDGAAHLLADVVHTGQLGQAVA